MSRCAVCKAHVHPLPGDRRRGPEGLLRCSDHVGEPLPEDAHYDLEPTPEEGEDYHLAKEVTFDVVFTVTVQAREKVWLTGAAEGQPVSGDDRIVDRAKKALHGSDALDDATITDYEYITKNRGFGFNKREGAEKLTEDGEPFDVAAWRDAQIREKHGDVFPPDGSRPEQTLEAFS